LTTTKFIITRFFMFPSICIYCIKSSFSDW